MTSTLRESPEEISSTSSLPVPYPLYAVP